MPLDFLCVVCIHCSLRLLLTSSSIIHLLMKSASWLYCFTAQELDTSENHINALQDQFSRERSEMKRALASVRRQVNLASDAYLKVSIWCWKILVLSSSGIRLFYPGILEIIFPFCDVNSLHVLFCFEVPLVVLMTFWISYTHDDAPLCHFFKASFLFEPFASSRCLPTFLK